MRFIKIVLLLIVYFFISGPAIAAPSCEVLFTHSEVRQKWNEAAEEFLLALNERRIGSFPYEVEGRSIIPPKVLEELESLTRNSYGKKIEKITKIKNITLEIWDEKDFVIVVNYYKNNQKTSISMGTFSHEYYIWRNYLKKILNGEEAAKVDLDNIPYKKSDGRAETVTKIKTNDFNTERTLQEYKSVFPHLASILRNFKDKNKVWIDMGAGSAKAQISFMNSALKSKKIEELPTLIAVGYKFPGGDPYLRTIEKKYFGKFTYIEGMQSAASLSRMKKADLITDLYGIYAYSENKQNVLNAYIKMLKPGGILLIDAVVPEEYIRPGFMKKIEIEISEHDLPFTVIRKISD